MGTQLILRRVDELQRRISQLAQFDALNEFNRAMEWIHDQGSFTFDLIGSFTPISLSQPVTDDPAFTYGEVTLPLDFDAKKAVYVTNTNGLPVEKVPFNRLWESFAMLAPQGIGYSTFSIVGNTLMLRPNQSVPTQVGIRYHVIFSDLVLGASSRLPDELEQLAVDLAETNVRRVFDVGEQWIAKEKDVKAEITKMLDGYRSTTQEPMPLEEAVAAIQETTRLGKA